MDLQKLPDSDICPKCKSKGSFILARDMVEYSPLVRMNDEWFTNYSRIEYLSTSGRVYCTTCATDFEAPEDL